MFVCTRNSNDTVSLGGEDGIGVDSICHEGEDIRHVVANGSTVAVIVLEERYTGITAAKLVHA